MLKSILFSYYILGKIVTPTLQYLQSMAHLDPDSYDQGAS